MIRRLLLTIGVAVSLALCAPGANATNSLGVEARLAEPELVARNGVATRVTLLLESPREIRLDGISVGGEGWRLLASDAPKPATLRPGVPLHITVTVLASDAKAPLSVTYEAEGRRERIDVDLSGEVRRLGATGAVATHAPIAEAQTHAAGAALARTPLPARLPGSPVDREPPADDAMRRADEVSAQYTIHVAGRFDYTRPDGVTVGADGMLVQVWDADTGPDQLLGAGMTDAFGFYSFDVTWTTCPILCEALPDVYTTFTAYNSEVHVANPNTNFDYAWATGTQHDFAGTTLDNGFLTSGDPGLLQPIHQMTLYTRTWRWLLSNTAYDMPQLRVLWPRSDGPRHGAGTIYLPTDSLPSAARGWHTEDIVHEYGHFWHYTFGVDAGGSYCNGVCDPSFADSLCGHCTWCTESAPVAWNEGWSDWLSDVIPRSFQSTYGDSTYWPPDHEHLQLCGAYFGDAERTEGEFANALRDIEDSTQDNELMQPGRDRLALGTVGIFTTSRYDAPSGPLDFFRKLSLRYPGIDRELLWETVRDNGFDQLDVLAPGPATNFVSTDHTAGVPSPDNTISMGWTRPTDDWSGAGFYSIQVSATPSLPDAVVELLDVTTWTSAPLAPGTWYVTIRASDRADHWSTSYATAGPYVIQAPTTANLAYTTPAGWARPAVPRPANNATPGSVPHPASLVGDAASTWVNLAGRNTGPGPTSNGFLYQAWVDGAIGMGFLSGALAANTNVLTVNGGPLTVRGGRHTFALRLDEPGGIAESNEADNDWAHPWVWSPATIAANTVVARAAPPARAGGWEGVVDGSLLFSNCDGLRIVNATGWWSVVWMRADSLETDYDLQLHLPTFSPDTGFATPTAVSQRLPGQLDAVVVNRNVVASPTTWDVGVTNWSGLGGYTAAQATSQTFSVGTVLALAMPTAQYVVVREFDVASLAVGPLTVRVTHAANESPLHVALLPSTFTTGAFYGVSIPQGVTDPTTGEARIDFTPSVTGWYGVVVYRDPSETDGAAQNFTLQVLPTPPNPQAYLAAGWAAPLVPRLAPDANPGNVPEPGALMGDANQTWLNASLFNASPVAMPSVHSEAYLDGASFCAIDFGALDPFAATGALNVGPVPVTGGRHTLTWRIDPANALGELVETDNHAGEQWMWWPTTLPDAIPVLRPEPPDEMGGWPDVTDLNGGLWKNCDGVRTPLYAAGPNRAGQWAAIGMIPTGGDADLHLHLPSQGAHDGFGAPLVISGWANELTDYLLLNFNFIPFQAFDVGLQKFGGSPAPTLESVRSVYLGTPGPAPLGPFTLGAGHVLHLYEVLLPAGGWSVDVLPMDAGIDWGVSIHEPTPRYQSRGSATDSASSFQQGIGVGESAHLVAATSGYYAITVWKAGGSDLRQGGTYRLQVRPDGVTAVGDLPPVRTALVSVAPNPTRSRTSVAFDVAREAEVELEVYDLRGARVRTLARGVLPAGRHHAEWDGLDPEAKPAPLGVYFVRLRADARTEMRKLVLAR